ncbi:siroheme synthase [Phycicoccus sp. Root563]|uniref:uroporphyrinogen-III C-methyltransferase n=1 Tax=unclassified Phycicoccus TaxID=2637926 RepID=UPI0007036503|nr:MULTISPECIES: uroporphyrinogen-III C-methyltransferase [unclassified Phycicoccus]KQU66570.1 siroheme synthase [Phycicoccus sp. Root101]KQZ87715.1 siroheme synthase [Phycicoccus sp. Root563]
MTTLMGLDLAGRRVLVAGGGPVAARRALSLVADGALVTVVAPQLCEDLVDAVVDGVLTWVDREVAESDLEGAWLVHAATDDVRTNRRVSAWATARQVWSVCASVVKDGTARTPATTRHAGLVVGVASDGGADPARAGSVRDQLALALQTGDLDLRRRRRPRTGWTGRVVLVGGGPGAPDLMTVRGRRALAEADVVVTDRLGPTSLLASLPPDVEVIDVGKVPGAHAVSQDQINAVLVEQAQRGRVVVRLKGGDPFLFGRGGEEQTALAAHGIPVEVVPGVSSALAAPAAAGIPVTHRGTVAAVHVTHGHGTLEEAAVRAVVDGSATLVVLMGVSMLGQHVRQLLDAGASPALAAAVVEDATLPTQRVTRASLSELVGTAESRGVRAPAVVVIGSVAAADLLEPIR